MTELRHGWTVGDVADLVRRVTYLSRAKSVLTDGEAEDAASLAVIEMLYASEAMPSPEDLAMAGWRAIHREQAAVYRAHGLRLDKPVQYLGFHRYWGRGFTESFEDRVDERIALCQVWRELPPRCQEALTALVAAGGDRDLAASDLGMSPAGYRTALTRARRHARALWSWPEPPGPQWGSDRRSTGGANTIRRRMQRRAAYRRTA